MEPISASIVVALLAKYGRHLVDAATEVLDDVVKDRMKSVLEAVRSRFSHDPVATGALDRLADQPDNPNRQAAVTDHLDEVLHADPEFGQLLASLVAAVPATSNQVQVSDSGAVAVGGDVTISGGAIASGRDVSVIGTLPPLAGQP
jgi:hypothetical protein